MNWRLHSKFKLTELSGTLKLITDQSPVIVQFIGNFIAPAYQLTTSKEFHFSFITIDIGKVILCVFKTSQEATFLVHAGQAGFDHLPGFCTRQEVIPQDAPIIV